MTAYLHAFWHGTTTGPAEWLGWIALLLIGAGLALALVRVIGWVCDNWPGDLDDPSIYCADDVRDPTKE